MEGGAAVLRSSSSSSSNSVPNSKYPQQRMRSQSTPTTNARKNYHQIRRFNSMVLDQNTIMMMMMMDHQYQYPHHQYQYQRGGGGGLFLNPPISPGSSSSSSLLLPPIPPRVSSHHNNHEQPPLLPLPVVSKQQRFQSLPPKRSQSLSPTQFNKTPAAKVIDENGTITPKKLSPKQSQPSKNNSSSKNKKVVVSPPPSKTTRSTKTRSEDLIGLNPSGPDPESLPKDVSKVLLLPVVAGGGGMEKLSFPGCGSSIFSQAPPPSSLPLPKFSILRPKIIISCVAQAGSVTATAGGGLNVVDAGATDNLCKLLNLR